MNGLPYYKAYPRDFIEGTIGMSFEDKCAYRVVLDLIYMQGGNLPDDARYISGLLGCSIRKWKTIRGRLILADKIQVNGEFLTNYRAVSELETLSKLQDKQRENASGPRKNNNLKKPRLNHTEPDTDTEEESKKKEPSVQKRKSRIPDNFPDSDSKEKALSYWQKKGRSDLCQMLDDIVLAFRSHHEGKGTLAESWPATWQTWYVNQPRFHKPRQGFSSGPGGGDRIEDVETYHLERLRDGGIWLGEGPPPFDESGNRDETYAALNGGWAKVDKVFGKADPQLALISGGRK